MCYTFFSMCTVICSWNMYVLFGTIFMHMQACFQMFLLMVASVVSCVCSFIEANELHPFSCLYTYIFYMLTNMREKTTGLILCQEVNVMKLKMHNGVMPFVLFCA